MPIDEAELDPGVDGAAILAFRSIVLSPSGYAARDEFTLAHELMELHIPSTWRSDLPKAMKEAACDRGAAALVLPFAAFISSVNKLGVDLPALRRTWPNASWSTIAKRLVDTDQAATVANWEALETAWRYGSDPHPDEEHALAEVYAGRGRSKVRGVRAWRLSGEGMGRVLSVAK